MDDEELLQRVIERDEEAFRALYARHSPAVYGLLCRLASRNGDASDLLQETWLHAVRHLSLFRGQCTFRSWLTGIGLNCYREWRRRHSYDTVLDTGWRNARGDHESASGDPWSAEAQARLTDGCESIPPPSGAEDRLVGALRERGLLRRRRSNAIHWIAAAAAVLIALALMLWFR